MPRNGMECRILSRDPDIDLTIPMWDGPAILTGGLGGWQTVERVEDIALTEWQGQAPITQDVPLMLDGFADGESIERELNTIFKLGRDAVGNENVPPVFQIKGPIFFPDAHWVLPDGGIELDAASTIRRDDGELVRQAFTLHLLEYIRPDTVKLKNKKGKKKSQRGDPAKTGGTAFPGNTYMTRKGDTIVKIAADLYGDWKRWHEIAKLNKLSDPNRPLPAGLTLRLP